MLKEFRRAYTSVLVATDVAARGLGNNYTDVKDIVCVINYDFPGQVEDYVHRIGRTARAGATGTAVSFFTRENARMAKDLIGVLKEGRQQVPSQLYEMARDARENRMNSARGQRYNRWGTGGRPRSRSPRRDSSTRHY